MNITALCIKFIKQKEGSLPPTALLLVNVAYIVPRSAGKPLLTRIMLIAYIRFAGRSVLKTFLVPYLRICKCLLPHSVPSNSEKVGFQGSPIGCSN